jgi:hypothetical protein
VLFLGKSFDGLTSPETPKFAHYLDNFLHAWLLQDAMPLVFRLLQLVPIKGLQEFLDSADGIIEVQSSVVAQTRLFKSQSAGHCFYGKAECTRNTAKMLLTTFLLFHIVWRNSAERVHRAQRAPLGQPPAASAPRGGQRGEG